MDQIEMVKQNNLLQMSASLMSSLYQSLSDLEYYSFKLTRKLYDMMK